MKFIIKKLAKYILLAAICLSSIIECNNNIIAKSFRKIKTKSDEDMVLASYNALQISYVNYQITIDKFTSEVEKFLKLCTEKIIKNKSKCEEYKPIEEKINNYIIDRMIYFVKQVYDEKTSAKQNTQLDIAINIYVLLKKPLSPENKKKFDEVVKEATKYIEATKLDESIASDAKFAQNLAANFAAEDAEVIRKRKERDETQQQLSIAKAIKILNIEYKDLDVNNLIDAEMGSVMKDSIPPKFCYKSSNSKDAVGYFPKLCPNDYKRSFAECIKDCNKIKRMTDACPGGLTEATFGCECKATKKLYYRIPLSEDKLTNFDKKTVCDSPLDWHHGALCYKSNCKNIIPGYSNCGFLACAIDKKDCGKEIAKIVAKTVLGIAEFSLFIITFGTSGLVHKVVEEAGAHLVGAHTVATESGMEFVLNNAQKAAVEITFKSGFIVTEKISDIIIESVDKEKLEKGMAAGNQFITSVYNNKNEKDPNKKFLTREYVVDKAVDLFIQRNLGYIIGIDKYRVTIKKKVEEWFKNTANSKRSMADTLNPIKSIKEKYENCKKTIGRQGISQAEKEAANVECAKGIMEIASKFDITGLVGLAATFMYPKCPNQN